MLFKRLSAFALLSALMLPFAAIADIGTGLGWLATQPNADGSFGATPTSLATQIQTTAEVLRAYQVIGQTNQPAYLPAIGYLDGDAEVNTEFLARKIVVKATAGGDVSSLVSALVARQNTDGGFGHDVGYDSAVLDAAFALEALASANYTTGQLTAGAVGFLLSRQQASGGWNDGANDASVYTSAVVLRALGYYRNTYQGVASALTKGHNFLLSRRGADGLWDENFISAIVLTALAPNVADLSSITASATALSDAQQSSGGWNDDAFTTALALQALRAYELRQSGASPTTGSVSGYVLKAGSTEPIAGATVSLRERAGSAVTTNGDGYYLLSNVPTGSYTVEASKTGFNPASTTAAVHAG